MAGPATGRLLRPGESWNIAWAGVGEDAFVEVAANLDGTDLVASCRGLSGTGLAVPAELTAAWPAAAPAARVQVGVERTVDSGGDRPVTLLVRRVGAAGMASATVVGAP